jgi:hypothetical protein
LRINYSNQSIINPGNYNVLFNNGLISINSNLFTINNLSYPILRDVNNNIINPFIWYKFDDNSNNMLLDSSANNYNLYNSNQVSFDNVNFIKGNGSITLNNSFDQYLTISNSINYYNIQNINGISFCFWFKINRNSGSYSKLFDFNNNTTSFITCGRYLLTNQLYFYLKRTSLTSASIITTNDYVDNSWHHLIWNISNTGQWEIYIDNTIVSFIQSLPINIGIDNVSYSNNFFGKSSFVSNGYLNGNIDDYRIYNFNLSANQVNELYNGKIQIYEKNIIEITGNINTINIDNQNSNYKYACFNNSGTFTINSDIICDILIVGGGGGGGCGGGGGGAGAVLYTTNLTLTSGTYNITIGNGGIGASGTSTNGSNGGDSFITINSIAYTAVGGGGGGTRNDASSAIGRAGNNGGSGGGGSHSDPSTTVNIGGTSTKNTYSGWTSLGNNGGNGYDGTTVYGSGGGGGAGSAGGNAGSNIGGNGGSGVVILRYQGSQRGTGGTITTTGGYTIHTFTGSGTFSVA